MKNVTKIVSLSLCSIFSANALFGMQMYDYQLAALAETRHQLNQRKITIMINSANPDIQELQTLIEQEMPQLDLDVELVTCLNNEASTIYEPINLIKLGADPNCRCSFQGMRFQKTPLMLAVRQEIYLPVVHFLLQFDADATAQDVNHNTALTLAAINNNFGAAKLIVEHLKKTTEQQAMQQSHNYSLDEELYPSAALTEAIDEWQACPLEVANCCIQPFLPSDVTRHINHQNHFRWTALHYAARDNNKEMVEYLLAYGADATLTNNDEETAADLTDDDAIKKLLNDNAL